MQDSGQVAGPRPRPCLRHQVAKTIGEEYVFEKGVEILWIVGAVCGKRNASVGFQKTSGVHRLCVSGWFIRRRKHWLAAAGSVALVSSRGTYVLCVAFTWTVWGLFQTPTSSVVWCLRGIASGSRDGCDNRSGVEPRSKTGWVMVLHRSIRPFPSFREPRHGDDGAEVNGSDQGIVYGPFSSRSLAARRGILIVRPTRSLRA